MPVVWIVVLNWNGIADTLACLASLRRLRYGSRKVVVVDNGSTDGSVVALRVAALDGSFELVESSVNRGYAGGNNLGISCALDRGADYILVLNNDTTVDPTLLDELVSAASRHPEAGCFGPWIYYMEDPERLWFTRSQWNPSAHAFSAPGKGELASEVPEETVATDYVCGAALFFRSEVAARIGLLEERFFLVYEDSDWCFRARRAGYQCLVIPRARVWHKVGMSFGSEASPLRTYFSVRNKLFWAERNAGRGQWLRMVAAAVRRLLPMVKFDRAAAGSIPRALIWTAGQFSREFARRRRDPRELARDRGVRDYLLRRFGDCPEEIRQLSVVWSNRRGAG
jgi:hypothetical protein